MIKFKFVPVLVLLVLLVAFYFWPQKNNKYVWPKGTDLFNNSFEMAYGFFAARGIRDPAPQPPPRILSSPVQENRVHQTTLLSGASVSST
jgi:hypothetical protein